MTRVNITTIKKDKKIKKNLSQVEYYSYYKKVTLPTTTLINNQKINLSLSNLHINDLT